MNQRAYWSFRFKKSWPYSLAILVIFLLASISLIANFRNEYRLSKVYMLNNFGTTLIYLGFFIAVLMGILPRNKYYSKRSTDIYASLPLDRNGVFWIDFLFGFLQIFLPWALAFLIGVLFFPVSAYGDFIPPAQAGYLFLYGILSVIEGWVLSYSLATYANNLFDSFFLVGLGTGFPYILMLLISTYPALNTHFQRNVTEYWPSQVALINDSHVTDGYKNVSATGSYSASAYLTPWYCYFIQALICLIFLSSAYHHFQTWKAENAGESAKGTWGYQTWLAAWFLLLYAMLPATTSTGFYGYWVPLLLGLALGYLILLCIFQRKIRISKTSLIVGGCVLALGTMSGFILTHYSQVYYRS
jgi:hypothetical protein